MIFYFSAQHELHAPTHDFFRGERVPCFESPARANFVHAELLARGHEVRVPAVDSSAALAQVHSPRYLAFVQSAWAQWLALDAANAARQPFPSVWPVRTLRSDVEPANFVARLGLYSMDNGSPLLAGDFDRLGARLKRLGLPTLFVLEGGYAAAELGVHAAHVMDAFERS